MGLAGWPSSGKSGAVEKWDRVDGLLQGGVVGWRMGIGWTAAFREEWWGGGWGLGGRPPSGKKVAEAVGLRRVTWCERWYLSGRQLCLPPL